MFWPSDDLFLLASFCDVDNVGFATFFVDYSNPAMISSVGHAFVHRWFN